MGWFGNKEEKQAEILGLSPFTRILLGSEKYSINHNGRIKPLPQSRGAGFTFDPKDTLPVFVSNVSDHFSQNEPKGIIKCDLKERRCLYKNWKYNVSEPLLDFNLTEDGINLLKSENTKGTYGIKLK